MIGKGIAITDFDSINYKAWAEKGIDGLRASVPERDFAFYVSATKDLTSYRDEIERLLKNPDFTYHQTTPTWEDLLSAYKRGGVCEVVLNSRTLDQKEGFVLHRVVVLEVTDSDITFHDPRKTPRPARKESRELFEKAWLQAPELCIYEFI